MAPRSSQTTGSNQKTMKKIAKATLKVNSLATTTSTKRMNPLTAFSNLPSSQTQPRSQPAKDTKNKGKEKATEVIDLTLDDDEKDAPSQLWVDQHEPTTQAELAVHNRKVDDVRGWLNEAFAGKTYRRILALTGPAGTAKTTTIRVLAREMDFDVLEWSGTTGTTQSWYSNQDIFDDGAMFAKFESFLARAFSCHSVFNEPSRSTAKRRQQVVLMEDLPNILHGDTKARFHAALQALVNERGTYQVPLVFIVSDSGLRGEASDERQTTGSWREDHSSVIDIRTVIPSDLLHGPYVTQMRFNPIAPTIMRKALQALLSRQFASSKSLQPSKNTLDVVVESANGDIRSAINALQFSCIATKTKKRAKGRKPLIVMEAVTRREQSLALFHLIGKVLYNKRKGDPPVPSASAKDIQKEKDLDAQLKDPPALPHFFSEHQRRTSRVNIDTLYADSSIDSSLFSLYIHQNYTQFCNDVDELDGVADNLSWMDASGGEQWYQANPYRFHMLTMGTLHALPSPVERRSQKVYKPDFFSSLEKEKDAWSAVHDVRRWVTERAVQTEDGHWRVGGWSGGTIGMELGAVLKARSLAGRGGREGIDVPPLSHRTFSAMNFVLAGGGGGAQLGEMETDEHDADVTFIVNGDVEEEDTDVAAAKKGGWLDSDDIEDD